MVVRLHHFGRLGPGVRTYFISWVENGTVPFQMGAIPGFFKEIVTPISP